MRIFACIKYFYVKEDVEKNNIIFSSLPFSIRCFDFWRVSSEQFQLFFTVQTEES